MLSVKEYDILQKEVIAALSKKRFTERYKEIISDIKELSKASDLCNKQEITYSSVLHQVRFLKGTYNDELKEIIQSYQEIIFPDFTYKNDLNTMINGPYALKIWLTRYLCLRVLKCELSDVIQFDLKDLSITQQYQEIDVMLFQTFMNVKVTSN